MDINERAKWLNSILNCHETYYNKPFELIALGSFRNQRFQVNQNLNHQFDGHNQYPMSILLYFNVQSLQ